MTALSAVCGVSRELLGDTTVIFLFTMVPENGLQEYPPSHAVYTDNSVENGPSPVDLYTGQPWGQSKSPADLYTGQPLGLS